MQPAADAAAGPVAAPRSLTRRTELLGGGLLAAILVVVGGDLYALERLCADVRRGRLHGGARRIRHGQEIGSQVYLVQPPGFYFLLEWIGGTIGPSLRDLRIGMLLVALVAPRRGLRDRATLRRRRGRPRRRAGCSRSRPRSPSTRPASRHDPPSLALGLVALALAVWSYGPARERRERPWLAAAAGVALACSILVKLFTGTIFVPLVALAIRNRTSWRTLVATVAGGLGTLAVLAITHVHTVDDFWRGSVSGQLANRRPRGAVPLGQLRPRLPLLRPPHARCVPRRSRESRSRSCSAVRGRGLGLWPIWAWTASAVAFTVWMRPLLDHHLVLLAAADRRAGRNRARCGDRRDPGTERPPARLVAAAVLVAGAGMAQQWRQLDRNVKPNGPDVLWAADVLRTNAHPDAYVITDLPYAAVLADRRIAGPAVDTSWGRVLSGKLSADDVLRIADDYDVNVVVTGRMLLRSPGLAGKLRARFPVRRTFPGGGAVAYLR